MVLHVDVDIELLERRVRDSQEALLQIYWRNGDQFYPCANWLDFGLVIMGWWTRELTTILGEQGSRNGKLSFMDGPYSIKLNKDVNTSEIIMTPYGENYEWRVRKSELIGCVQSACNKIIQAVSKENLYLNHCRALESSVRRLDSL